MYAMSAQYRASEGGAIMKLLTISQATLRYVEARGGTRHAAHVMLYRQKQRGTIKFAYVPLGISGRTVARVDSISLDEYLTNVHIGRPKGTK